MVKVYMMSRRNQIKYCVVYWWGPGGYAGLTQGDTFEVFPCENETAARNQHAAYLGCIEVLSTLLTKLKERGVYEIVGIEFKEGEEAIEEMVGE